MTRRKGRHDTALWLTAGAIALVAILLSVAYLLAEKTS